MVLIGGVMPYLFLGLPFWAKGPLVAELGMLPFMIIAFHRRKRSIIPILVLAGIIGMALSFALSFL